MKSTASAVAGDDRGATAIELALGILVILIPMTLLALSFGPTLERRAFVRSASAETARYIVLSEGDEVGALDRLREMALNNGVRPAEVSVSLCGGAMSRLPEPVASSCVEADRIGRGAVVVVRLEVDVPVIPGPRVDNAIVRVGYEHAEVADLYRSIP